MNTGVPLVDQLREALQAEHKDEFLINFLRGERKAEIYFERQEVLRSRSKAPKTVRVQKNDPFPSILKVFKVALSGCLGSCLVLQFSTQQEKESCGKQFDGSSTGINVQQPSDLCRLDSMDSYASSEALDDIDNYLHPHSSSEGIRHRMKIR